MVYGGPNQVAVSQNPIVAVPGLISDIGPRDIISRAVAASLTVDAGRVVVGGVTTCELPDAAADMANVLGIAVYEPLKMPNPSTPFHRFTAGDMVAIQRFGRGWARLKTGTPVFRGAVYVYVGATAADRGMVSPVAAADYALAPGMRFTGRVDTSGEDVAEIQIEGVDTMSAGLGGRQFATGTIINGVGTINTGITVTPDSKVIPWLTSVITGTTNMGGFAHIPASNVVGPPSTGTVVVNMLTAAGVLDSDAAGSFAVEIIG